ncbi:Uncharacterised protein [Cedecea lapagei]|uniref:Uncharacterized protein n=1 Tax=Cedecea lapagei TaxID=158823 RepID=A0A3S5DPU0_9ENTR|nr:hypothetical protein [Cedecea lapagei]VEB98815.1 Uncharacterised protein [Cedecea lapagei]
MKNIELIHSLTKLFALIIITVIIVFVILGLLIIFPSKDAYSFSNITDILSALSTFGTLVVAYMAYKAAPDWFAQKSYVVATDTIDEIIYKDLKKLKTLSYKLTTNIKGLCHSSIMSIQGSSFTHTIDSNFNETLNIFMEFENLIFSMEDKIKSIARKKYLLSKNANATIDFISNSNNVYHNILDQMVNALAEIPYSDKNLEGIFKKIREDTTSNHEKLKNHIDEIHKSNQPLHDLIYYTHKNRDD